MDDINKLIQGKTYDTTKIEKINVVINDCKQQDINGGIGCPYDQDTGE